MFNVAIPTVADLNEVRLDDLTNYRGILSKHAYILEQMAKNIESLGDSLMTAKKLFMDSLRDYVKQFNEHADAILDDP